MPFGSFGFWEVLLVLLVLLPVFGPRRLPELGGALGKGIREFRRSMTEIRSEIAQAGTEKKELSPPAGTTTDAGAASRDSEPASPTKS